MTFQLPAELPVTTDELSALLAEATAEIQTIQDRFDNDGDLSEEDVTYLTSLTEAVQTLNTAIAEASADEDAHRTAVNDALAAATAATASAEADEDESADADGDVETVDGEIVDEAPATVAARGTGTKLATKKAPAKRPVNFSGLGTHEAPKDDEQETGPGWVVAHGAPGFATEQIGSRVGFAQMGKALDSVRQGHGVGRLSGRLVGPKMRQEVARMTRALDVVDDQHSLVAAINKATDQRNLPGGSLTAAGGWCAPSEQLYDFCDVPDATDLVSLPEIGINRGGLRWPVEPDLTSIFESFEFFFTEPELEAVDPGTGLPLAVKHCVEIPCPDEFEELRLNAVGYCVEAGILQKQGWPESIEWFLRSLTQEHFRAMSRRTLRDMWNGGNPVKTFDANLAVGATSGVLNALALYATNLRLHRGLGRTALIEGVAPSWFFEVLRADMAMMEGIDTKDVSDGLILGWLTSRHLAFQFVGDWQTRGLGQPGHLDTMRWPGHVDIMMYPAGTWFRSLSNIIEVGVLFPKEQLQINRYTEFFTEDAIAIGKRCGVSANLRIPLKLNGGYGAPVTVGWTDTTPDFGGSFDAKPIESGQVGLPETTTLTISGAPTGGNFKLTYLGEETAAINIAGLTKDTIKAALVALDDNLGADDFTVTGTGPFSIVARGGGKVTVTTKALTGGTSPDVVAA